ncbi:MAG: carbohydrate ABC transporter permease [Chloroflexota bacterium]
MSLKNNNPIFLAILQVLMTVFLIFFSIPIYWMVISSFKAPTEIFMTPPPFFGPDGPMAALNYWLPFEPRWANYVDVFTLLPFGRYMLNTFFIVAMAVLGTVISSAMVAYSFARLRWPGREFFFALLLATMMLPEAVTLVPRFVIFRTLGWIDTFAPLIVPFWLATTPIYVFLMRQFFRGLPLELDEAAFIDGASRVQILFRILLPLSVPVIATVTVFAMLQHYQDFMSPLIYLNSMEKYTMALGVNFFNDSDRARWELIFASATVMVVPMLVLFFAAQRYFVEGIAMTGFGGR